MLHSLAANGAGRGGGFCFLRRPRNEDIKILMCSINQHQEEQAESDVQKVVAKLRVGILAMEFARNSTV